MSDPLVLKISADTNDLKKSLNQVVEQLKKTNTQVQTSTKTSSLAFASFIGSIGSAAVTKAFSVLSNGIKSFVGSLDESINLAKIQEKSINDLNQSFVKTGIFSKEASEDFQKFASSLQNASTIGDEVILKNAAIIQSLGQLDSQGLKRATQAAADLAAGLGKSFETTSQLIGKVASGNTAALAKLGIQFDATGDKSKDLNTALTLIEQRFGGRAAGELLTYDGTVKAIGNTFGDLRELIGGVVTGNSTLRGSFQGVNVILQAAQEFIKKNTVAIQEFISSGIRGLVGSIPIAATGINLLIDTFTGLSVVFDGIKFVINETIRGFVLLAQGAVDIASSVESVFGVSSDVINGAKESLASLNETLAITSEGFIKDAAGTIEANRQKKAAISDFAAFAEQALNENIARAEAQSQAEINILREQESQLNALRIENEEAERIRKEQAFLTEKETKLAYIRDILGAEEALKLEADLNKLTSEKKTNDALLLLNASYTKARKDDIFTFQKFETLSQKEKIANVKSTLGSISSLQSSSSKELFAIGKAAALATATIDGFAAVQKALSSAPPPFNFALAALVGVATGANIAKIAASQPPTGAFNGALVEGGSMFSDTQPFMLSKGEVVAPRRDFDDVVEGTARQRGFVKRDEVENGANGSINISIQGDFIGEEGYVNNLIEKIRDAVQFRNADLGVA